MRDINVLVDMIGLGFWIGVIIAVLFIIANGIKKDK